MEKKQYAYDNEETGINRAGLKQNGEGVQIPKRQSDWALPVCLRIETGRATNRQRRKEKILCSIDKRGRGGEKHFGMGLAKLKKDHKGGEPRTKSGKMLGGGEFNPTRNREQQRGKEPLETGS